MKWTMLVLLAPACGNEPDPDAAPSSDADADTDSDADTDADADTDSDTDTDPQPVDSDADGFDSEADCDDADATVFPGAPDVCGDDRVTDCDRTSDDGLVTVDGGASFGDLQAALDAAGPDAEVLVCPGTWSGAFAAKVPVRILAHGDATDTTLDAGGTGPTLTLAPGSSIAGLTLTGGLSEGSGGGVSLAEAGTLAVTDCVLSFNNAEEGGAIGLPEDSVATVAGTRIEDNHARLGGGGIAAGPGSTVDLTGSVVTANSARYGGGVALDGATLVGGQVRSNTANAFEFSPDEPGGGGGVSVFGDGAIVGTEIVANTSTFGAGFSAVAGTVTLTDVSIHDNTTFGFGAGGMVTFADVALLGTTTLTANVADVNGGGLWLVGGTVTGGTISDNVAHLSGGGAYVDDGVLVDVHLEFNDADAEGGGLSLFRAATVDGCTISGNSAPSGGGISLEGYPPDLVTRVTVVGSTVSANQARTGAGAYVHGGELSFEASTIVGNQATGSGGGAVVVPDGSVLSSVGSDWGTDVSDNLPDDVLAGATAVVGYGLDATFSCGTECDPLP